MKELENYYGRLFTKYQLTAKEREIAEKVPSITKRITAFAVEQLLKKKTNCQTMLITVEPACF